MNTKTIRVLVVEKSSLGESILELPLIKRKECIPHFEVERVEHIDQALICLEQRNIDIIVLDLTLSEIEGIAGFHRTQNKAPDTPIVVVTDANEKLIDQALEDGAQDYLIKGQWSNIMLFHVLMCAIEEHQMKHLLQAYSYELQMRDSRFQQLIVSSPDGVVVVDMNGVVHFVNPSGEALFGQKAQDLVGQDFGFPVVPDEATEIDVIRWGMEEPGIAEMRIVQTEWEEKDVYLITLRDVTDRKKLQESLQYSELFNRLILNSIDSYILVVNASGYIVAVNASWKEFITHYSDTALSNADVGDNFIEIGTVLFGDSSHILTSIQAVLYGDSEVFDFEYEDYLKKNQTQRWFYVRVMPLVTNKQRFVVISFNDVSERKRVAWAEAEAKSNAERVKEQEREIRGLLQLTSSPTNITSSLFGVQPLHDSAPMVFEQMSRRYAELIEMAMEQRAYKVDHGLSEELRSMAERLGFLRAGPRDVIEIHSTVLQQKSSGAHPMKAQAYTEEGRLVVLELMGHLVSYYRNYSLGSGKIFKLQPPA